MKIPATNNVSEFKIPSTKKQGELKISATNKAGESRILCLSRHGKRMIVTNSADAKRWPTDEKKTMAKTLLGEILMLSNKGFWSLTLRIGLKSYFSAEKYIWTGFVSDLPRGWTNVWFYFSGEIWLIHSQCRFNGHCTMRIILLKSSNRVIFFISSFVWQQTLKKYAAEIVWSERQDGH